MNFKKTSPPTAFQLRVYDAARRIPKGQVVTYGFLARELGCGSAQAIGQALRHNPFAPEVPCHRVVASNRTLHGFNGQISGSEIERKRKLLEAEKVTFETDGRIAPECMRG